MLEYITAETLASTRERDLRARCVSIALACRHHKSFLKRLQHFELLPKPVATAVERLQEGGQAPAQLLRTEKIAQKQQERAIEAQLQQLRSGAAHTDEDAHASASGAQWRFLQFAELRRSQADVGCAQCGEDIPCLLR